MSEEYNKQVASHYSKYRPPLHEKILSKTLDDSECFNFGLDIGCGTGRSSKPLMKYCKKVFGIDPSQSMIDRAKEEPLIKFFCGNEQNLNQFEKEIFGLITFAGSLFYSKNETLRKELNRVCQTGATIVIYDFEVLIGGFLQAIGLDVPSLCTSNYDHSINISDWKEFEEVVVIREQMSLSLSSEELAHFILSHSTWYDKLANQFEERNPFNQLTLFLRSKSQEFQLPVNIFYSRYKVR